MLGNIMYIFLSVVVSGICFYLAFNSMKEQFEQELEMSVLTKKETRAKRREHSRKVWLFVAAELVWLVSIVVALSGSDYFVAFILTAAAIVGLGYLLIKCPNEKQTITIKFLSVALGLGLGLVIGTLIKAGTVTYFLGICFAIALPVLVHFVGKANIDDIDDDDDEEPAREVTTAQPPHDEEPAQPVRMAQPTVGYRPAKPNKETVNRSTRRRRSGLKAENDGGEREFDVYIIEQLSKTEEGREQLLQLLRANR
ncbi:hypothetical protein IJG96_00910 [Candidatus Saccharibacteria bacterium]|nr:hypothetical protein [Candidatus Saccharibacteria bacterium]